MSLSPTRLEELRSVVVGAQARRERLGPIDRRGLDRIVEYRPEDMTVTVEAGRTLAALQQELARCGQWLPVDPPQAAEWTLGEILDADVSGPHRFGYGTLREHLLGLRAMMADGRLIRSGGKVVKNVAGYDLLKLFVGAQGTLGVIVEATFKVLPLPESRRFLAAPCASLGAAAGWIAAVLESPVMPVVLDWHRLDAASGPEGGTVVLGLAGTREDVEWQTAAVGKLGPTESASLEYDGQFWSASRGEGVRRRSVLPTRLAGVIEQLGGVPFVARAGTGTVCYRGGPAPPEPEVPWGLTRRIKATYDPHGVFPELTL
ncbi:MAG: FAD-binding oxidoreductase [Verrucomicrobia bacterium]|nr:FAD-binding oxidoreductase [Verrucomicrobiota bacterium]